MAEELVNPEVPRRRYRGKQTPRPREEAARRCRELERGRVTQRAARPRVEARRSVAPYGGWGGTQARALLEEMAREHPPPQHVVARGCNGACTKCRGCVRCRLSLCFGGHWMDLGCTACRLCRQCRTSWSDEEYARAETERNFVERRWTSISDLPAPPDLCAAASTRCPWCDLQCETRTKRSGHLRTCKGMPFVMYHARVSLIRSRMERMGLGTRTERCKHCGLGFDDARGCARHASECVSRLRWHGLPLNRGRFASRPEDAGLPADVLAALRG